MGDQKYTILLVDDEQLLLEASASYLREEFNAHTALNGAEAWEILKKEKIDCLVTDINMPIMNGFQLLEKINDSEISIKTLVVSGFIKPLYYDRFKELQLDSHLLKPYDIRDLTEMIKSILKGS